MKKTLSFLLAGVMTFTMTVFAGTAGAPKASAASSGFTFNGSMSKEVLRNYASRAVTFQGLCAEGLLDNPILDEDLRMIKRTGAKFIGRAAFYSWSGNLSAAQIEEHFALAEKNAKKAHEADPELILQAGVFEIVYEGAVNNLKIPSWVFEAFGQPVENRNFRYDDIAFPDGYKRADGTLMGTGAWGNNSSAWPRIANLETQMYFYYLICRYIDAGYEAIHLGQAEAMMENKNISNATEWMRVTTLAREYAKTHARRGIVLFDCHSAIDSPGMKVGNKLVLDLQGAGAVPNETKKADGAMQCEIRAYDGLDPKGCWLSWVGRSAGGEHPLGFQIDNLFTIIELDNYGGNGKPGAATPAAFYNWGYDDITWFALQPEWYRNQFILETDEYLKTYKPILDSEGKQVYFFQPAMRRVLTEKVKDTYTPGSSFSVDFILDYFDSENVDYEYADDGSSFSMTTTAYYRANRQSDGCPNGGGQEDAIREIFLGKDAPEDPELLKVVLPEGYSVTASTPSTDAPGKTTTQRNPASPSTAKPDTGKTTASASSSMETPSSDAPDTSETGGAADSSAASSEGTASDPASAVDAGGHSKGFNPLPIILGSIAVLLLAGGGFCLWYFKLRKPGAGE